MKAHALHRPRYDGYAKPIAPLREASVESLYDREVNQRMREHIWQELERHYRQLLCRGTYGELTIRVGVKDGVLMDEARTVVEQRHVFGQRPETPRPAAG